MEASVKYRSSKTRGWPLAALCLVVGCAASESTKLGSVSGIVTDEGNAPLAGVEVETEPATGAAVSDATGAYALTSVGAGTYQLKASKAGYEPSSKQVVVEAGVSVFVDLELAKTVQRGTIAGTVTQQGGGTAVVGASVATTPASATAYTGPDGTYTLTGVVAGTYAVSVTAAGFNPLEKTGVVVKGSQTTTTDFSLTALITYDTTCETCHFDSALIVADLTADPPPEAAASGSVGEG